MMTDVVAFPGLGLEFTIDRVAVTLFGFPVYWYGIILATGLFLGILYAFHYAKRVGVDEDRLVDVLMAGVIGAIVGARLYFVAFSWDMYKDDLWQIFNVRHGGIAIYGAIIGGIAAGAVLCKMRGVRMLPTLDLAAGGFLIGQAIGRWGNFVNIEAFGDNTTSIFGMTSPAITGYLEQLKRSGAAWTAGIDPNLPVHPTFLYESAWCLLGFLLMNFIFIRRRRFDGECFLIYAAWYGAGRFVIEGLRTDSLMWGGVRVSQALALVCVIVAAGIWLWMNGRVKKGLAPQLFVRTADGQRILNGTYYQKAAVPEIVVEEFSQPGGGSAGDPEPDPQVKAFEEPAPVEAADLEEPSPVEDAPAKGAGVVSPSGEEEEKPL